jgi:hypothetical protein
MTAVQLFYETQLLLLLLLGLLQPLQLETDRFKGNRGASDARTQRRRRAASFANPANAALQKDTQPRVESTSESEGDFENAFDRTIIQSSDETETPPTRTPPPSPRMRRRPSPDPSPASGARPRTQKQTNKDRENMGILLDQPFPRERKKYERKKK